MVPYFLSAGVHVRRDLTAVRDRLAARFPHVEFLLAEPLGRHPLLLDVAAERTSRPWLSNANLRGARMTQPRQHRPRRFPETHSFDHRGITSSRQAVGDEDRPLGRVFDPRAGQ